MCGSYGSVPPVRAEGKQSLEPRDRPAENQGQLYLASLPLRPAGVADLNVGLMAHTENTPAGGDRLLTLHSSRHVAT
jgi:hypothetical protein